MFKLRRFARRLNGKEVPLFPVWDRIEPGGVIRCRLDRIIALVLCSPEKNPLIVTVDGLAYSE